MKEYYVTYVKSSGEECMVDLPSFRKLLWWFLRTAQKCNFITIFTYKE